MGAATILDELEALFDGFSVTAGSVSTTFTWVQWEEQEEARGDHVMAESDFDLNVSDIGGGAQAVTEDVTLRFVWANQGRDADWTVWKNAFIAAVLAAVRGNEKGFTGGYYVEVQDIAGDRVLLHPPGARSHIVSNSMDFLLVARRHDVYA